jgi:KipI family sensor histidine kinase inhibitor
VEVPVTYEGADLGFVADAWGTDREGVVARHTGIEYVAAFCGFSAGFSYLAGLPAGLAVPRLGSPRPRVPPGSVGLAGAWCGVYPTASPGGWRLLGRTDVTLWDQTRAQPALLAPGTRVRFVPA